MEIKNVVVIGSGTMGCGIAAQLCNANISVTLLDLTTEISKNARERIYKSRPPLLIDKSRIENINIGNINDDFKVVNEADWIVEAIVERIDIKHNIYEKIFTILCGATERAALRHACRAPPPPPPPGVSASEPTRF